jgi:TonB family protein
MKTLFASLLLIIVTSQSAIVFANTAPENIIDLQQDAVIYKPSKVIKSFEMSYPSSARRNNVEGYVEVSYDVNEQGSPVNLRYNRISGLEIFETLIEKNFDDWEFEPAKVYGVAIIQKNLQRTFTFTLTKLTNKFPEPLMRRNFANIYLNMRKLLKEAKYEELGEMLTIMDKSNVIRFSENRQLSLVKFTYLERTKGSDQDKIIALENALKDNPRAEKTQKLNSKVKASLFKLYVENNQYRQALIQHSDLSRSEFSQDLLLNLAATVEQVMVTLRSGEPIATTVKIDGTELFTHYLSRRVFKIDTDSPVSFTELRCGKFNVQMQYAKNTLYQMPFDWNDCQLVLQAPQGSLVSVSEAAIYDPL